MPVLNPNHPVSQGLDEQYHKIIGIMLFKLAPLIGEEFVITAADVLEFQKAYEGKGMPTVVCHDHDGGLHVHLVDEATAQVMANEAGGRPC